MQEPTSARGPQMGNIDPGVLRRLHASAVTERSEILRLLNASRASDSALTGRRTVRGDAESARISRIESEELLLDCKHISAATGSSLFLSFAIEGRSYFFAVSILGPLGNSLRTEIPRVVYVAERRDRRRIAPGSDDHIPQRVILNGVERDWSTEGAVCDYSPTGLYVESAAAYPSDVGTQIRVRYLDGDPRGTASWGIVRHVRPSEKSGWVRLGLTTSDVPFTPPLPVDRRRAVSSASAVTRAMNGLTLLSAGVSATSSKVLRRVRLGAQSQPEIDVVTFPNGAGERLTGILDRSDSSTGGTAIVIPPAWGRTKETLLPLAATIVQTFRRAGESVSVLRFDGTRRRGESHKDPGYETEGVEHLPLLFSHLVDDIVAASSFMLNSPSIRASRTILVTFSAASIEGRRAVASGSGHNLSGWVSVVGSPDLQSGMRTVSGGIDYVAGVDQGLCFGRQEVMGVVTNIDCLIGSALEMRLAFLEDARRDMAQVSVPVTWIHGANDAWLDLERVRDVMGAGDVSQRKLIEVPTGHQLRSSKEALDVFMLVAEECASMALGRPLQGSLPRLTELEERRKAERSRLSVAKHDIRAFWRDYLLGRGDMLGIELMNATRAYDGLMAAQLAGLQLSPDCVVADVGAGTGSFLLALLDSSERPGDVVVDEIDYVPEAFNRAKERLVGRDLSDVTVNFIECDLENPDQRTRLFSQERYDAVLLSLVLSYVREPRDLLKTLFGAMRSRARIVASTLQRDADISRLYLESLDELRAGRAREVLGAGAELLLDESVRTFLNDMARVLDLEEQGIFRFLDPQEIIDLVRSAGFEGIQTSKAFGDPPQAVVVSAYKPR